MSTDIMFALFNLPRSSLKSCTQARCFSGAFSIVEMFLVAHACATMVNDNDNRVLFYVIALNLHQHPGKVDPRRWHCKQSHNAAARVEKIKVTTIADANACAEERCAVHNRHKGKKKETLEVSGSTNGTNAGSEMECTAGAVRAWVWRSDNGGVMEQGFSRTLNVGRMTSEFCT
jgi:hypothetical protein